MPKQTFFNLPEEKRKRILDCALEEFAERGYKQASISRIVRAADIAKGSFYQYFEDKDDLHAYIVKTMIADPKLRTFELEKGRLEDLNLTEYLRVVFRRQLADFERQPLLLKIGMDMATLVGEPIYDKLYKSYEGLTNTYLLPYIRHEVEQGELDPRVNIEILNFMLLSLGHYLTWQLTSGAVSAFTREMIDRLVDELDYILKNGVYQAGACPASRAAQSVKD